MCVWASVNSNTSPTTILRSDTRVLGISVDDGFREIRPLVLDGSYHEVRVDDGLSDMFLAIEMDAGKIQI